MRKKCPVAYYQKLLLFFSLSHKELFLKLDKILIRMFSLV